MFIKESSELLPLHPYGVSKVGQDLISYQYYVNDGIRCIRARIFNSTGTRKVNDVTSDFTYRAIKSEIRKDYRIKVGNLKTKRAILDQRDLINALLLLAEFGNAGDVYNICSESIFLIEDLLKMIEIKIGHKLHREIDETLIRTTDERIIVGDITKLKRDTGWEQLISMDQTIEDMLEYWRNKISN